MPYTTPTATAFKARYPAFTAVADATIEAFITEANRSVDTGWFVEDYQPGIMALAAHKMTVEGLGTSVVAQLAGFKSLTVGPLSLTREEAAGAAGTLASTVFGLLFLDLLRKNVGGGIAVAVARIA